MADIADYSRFLFCQGITDADGRLILSERVPFLFVTRDDTRKHTVTDGDTLWGLAGLYFAQLPRPSQFFWVICDFNGIFDPTLRLLPGVVLQVPSVRFVVEELQNEARRPDFVG